MCFIENIVKVCAFLAIFMATINLSTNATKSKINSDLRKAFKTDDKARKNIVLNFKGKPAQVLDNFSLMARTAEVNSQQFHENYIAALKDLRDDSQSNVLKYMKSQAVSESPAKHYSCWLTNQVFVKGADKDMVEKLASFKNVDRIHEERIYNIHKPVDEGPIIHGSGINVQGSSGTNAPQWNIKKIRAHEAWTLFGDGTGVRVGFIDTGMNAEHDIFRRNMVTSFKDAVSNKDKIYDDNGHGTHVAGIIAGKNGFGVAPGINIVCCKACGPNGECSESSLTTCGEFMQQEKPDIVSNSWGGPGGETWFDPIIRSWTATGMISVFSAGNSGPDCGTVGSPAENLNVISVASTNDKDGLSDFSSRGKCPKINESCPTVSAPGDKIISAWMSSPSSYKSLSGTSMAAPHATGLLALMTAQKRMKPATAKATLIKSCMRKGLSDPHQTCDGTPFTKFHNNMYGNGRIDCVKALQAMTLPTNLQKSQ